MIRRVTIQAPAKLNLGLEVIGRRPDGFHEIVTVFQAVSLFDTLELRPAHELTVASSDPALEGETNLVTRSLHELRSEAGIARGAQVTLSKQIPVAAGLGGASSDAAAALRAGRQLWRVELSVDDLLRLAKRLGSDVPFFLSAGTALGTGRGDELAPLPPLTGVWFVIVSPTITIPRKTPALYAALVPSDFSSGVTVRALATDLDAVASPSGGGQLPNPFKRALYALRPELAALPEQMNAAGAPVVALSGAGPSHFAPFSDPDQAARVAARLRADLGERARVVIATPVGKPPDPVST